MGAKGYSVTNVGRGLDATEREEEVNQRGPRNGLNRDKARGQKNREVEF